MQRGNQARPTLCHPLREQDKPYDTPSRTLCIYGNDPSALGKGSARRRADGIKDRAGQHGRPARLGGTRRAAGPASPRVPGWTSGSQTTAGAQAADHCGLGSGSGLAERSSGTRDSEIREMRLGPGQDTRVGGLGGVTVAKCRSKSQLLPSLEERPWVVYPGRPVPLRGSLSTGRPQAHGKGMSFIPFTWSISESRCPLRPWQAVLGVPGQVWGPWEPPCAPATAAGLSPHRSCLW